MDLKQANVRFGMSAKNAATIIFSQKKPENLKNILRNDFSTFLQFVHTFADICGQKVEKVEKKSFSPLVFFVIIQHNYNFKSLAI